jgi:hypothetical protein
MYNATGEQDIPSTGDLSIIHKFHRGHAGARLQHGIKTLFILPMRKASSRSSANCWVRRSPAGAGRSSLFKKLMPLAPNRSLQMGQLEIVLGAKEPMNAIADHRALPYKETTQAQHLFNLSGGLPADVHPRNEIAA